jgi:hypothetical protein
VRRLIVLHHTGPVAQNVTIARRIARKIRVAASMGECILADFEDVSPDLHVLEIIAAEILPDKVRVCGLSIVDQLLVKHLLRARGIDDSEGESLKTEKS